MTRFSRNHDRIDRRRAFAPPLLDICTTSWCEVGAKLVLEDGYDVVTVLDGNKLSDSQGVLHPYSILPAMKKENILLLDSVGSIFYSVPLPISQDREIKVLVGKRSSGVVAFAAGYSDGDASTATFNHPKSFAVDATGNVYVADRTNHVVRKISPSGETTTIAAGYSGKTGKIDGPAQNASFSSDFELVYIPGICALLISDRGNNLIRQLNLKPDDCRNESYPGIGVSSVSILATLSSVLAFIAGFLARPFVASSGEPHGFGKTWNPYPTKSVKIPPIIYSGIRNGVVSITASYMFVYKLVGTVFYHSLLRVENESKPELEHVVSLINSSDNLTDLPVYLPGDPVESKLDGLISSNLSDFVHTNQNQNKTTNPNPKNPILFRRKF